MENKINKNSIFVSIASYRDVSCTKTLSSIYQNAANPNKIFVGICQQNDKNDPSCINHSNEHIRSYINNIRIIKLPHYLAKGPTYARFLCSTLLQNEEYFFQIDSHTLFVKNWDSKLINMINDIKQNTNSKDIIISHYPKNYEEYQNKNPNNEVPIICKSFFNDRGMISFEGAENISMTKNNYIQTPYISAGMFFCESRGIRECSI